MIFYQHSVMAVKHWLVFTEIKKQQQQQGASAAQR